MLTQTILKEKIIDSFQRVEGSITKNRKGDRYVWGIVLFLAIASLFLIYSSTSALAYKSETANIMFLIKQVLFVLFGLGIIYFLHRFDYRYINKWVVLTLIYGSIGLLILTKLFGSTVNDANRWLVIKGTGIKFQTSDIAKLSIFIYISYYLSRRQDVIKEFKKAFVVIMGPPTIVCGIIALDNFSTGALLFMIATILCFIGRVNGWYLSLPVFAAAFVVCFLLFFASKYYDKEKEKMKDLPSYLNVGRVPTWISRVQAFLYPSKLNDRDRQSNTAKVAIAEGGLFGKFAGNSTQKNFLPDCFSDFIFAIIIEEYGLFGALVCILLYMGILTRGIIIFRRSPYAFGAFLALGLSFALTTQALMNMAVAVNIFPVTGFTLPFLSMGGTSFLLTCLSIGLILSVSRHSETETKPVAA